MVRLQVLILILSMTGCAGLTARKVPLEDRVAGEDDQRGFRYYLSRPYLVVSRRICLHQEILTGVVLYQSNDSGRTILHPSGQSTHSDSFAVRVLGPDGRPIHYDLSGNPRVVDKDADWHVLGTDASDPRECPQPEKAESDASHAAVEQAQFSPFDRPIDYRGLGVNWRSADVPDYAYFADDGNTKTVEAEPPPFQIAFLPDFEEQIAVTHQSWLAKSNLTLKFRDGWQLDSVQGNFDSTDVPVQLLKTLQLAIDQAATYEAARLKHLATIQPSGPSPAEFADGTRASVRAAVIRCYFLEPGVYRLNKDSERSAPGFPAACGLLADLGIQVVSDTKVVLLAAPIAAVPPTTSTPEVPKGDRPGDGSVIPAPPQGTSAGPGLQGPVN